MSVAFGRAYSTDIWGEARQAARELIKASLWNDVTSVHRTIAALADSQKKEVSIPSIRAQIWKKTYESIVPNDSYGIATALEVLAPLSHVDNLIEKAFSFQNLNDSKEGQKALRGVNAALDTIRSGFSEAVTRCLDFTDSAAVLELLSQRDVAKNIMIMMFSPLESIREPVQAIAGLAMDVESRLDCFRALLLNFPDSSLDGMTAFLDTFIKYAPRVPEACSLSKALALCFTDIIDVLCSNPDGLLHKTTFLQGIRNPGPEVQLPKWWARMSEALSIIFKCTIRWSTIFDDDKTHMIIWMRDALIFGRDMLAARKVIETGALALSPQLSKAKSVSHIGNKMVGDLQDVLLKLAAWLRLTDEELLFQAFALLQSLLGCFRETGIEPSRDAMDKLKRTVDKARSGNDENRPRLDTIRVDGLRDTLASFKKPESDDEVEIVEHRTEKSESEDDVQIVERYIKAKPETAKKLKPSTKSERLKEKSQPVQQKLTSGMSKLKVQDRKPVPPKLGRDFTRDEQRKLNLASTLPKFSRTAVGSTSISRPSDRTKPAGVVFTAASKSKEPVASSDASGGSDDEPDATLEDLAKVQKSAAVKKHTERRQVKMLDMPMNGRSAAYDRFQRRNIQNAQAEEDRRLRLRMKPDVSSLHRRILSWNYDHDGPHPPGENFKLHRVPDRFDSARQYGEVFEPLLLMECWAQIQQSKEADEQRYECRIVGRQYENEWPILDVMITEGVQKDFSLSETDIVLLRHPTTKSCRLLKVRHFKSSFQGLLANLWMMPIPGDAGPQVNSLWQLSKVFR